MSVTLAAVCSGGGNLLKHLLFAQRIVPFLNGGLFIDVNHTAAPVYYLLRKLLDSGVVYLVTYLRNNSNWHKQHRCSRSPLGGQLTTT